MDFEKRIFQRYTNYVPNINIICLDDDHGFSNENIDIIDLSFAGICINSDHRLRSGNFVIRIGKRRIKLHANTMWCSDLDCGRHKIGMRISFSDGKSYSHWTKLLHALNAVDRANDDLEAISKISEKELQFLPQLRRQLNINNEINK